MWLPLVSAKQSFPAVFYHGFLLWVLWCATEDLDLWVGLVQRPRAGNCSIGGFMKNKTEKTKQRAFKPIRRGFLAATGALGALSATGLGIERARAAGKLVFYNWSTYIDEETIPEFSDQFGIEVSEDFFADNDELFNKLRTGNPGYDVIVPTNDYVHRMIEQE